MTHWSRPARPPRVTGHGRRYGLRPWQVRVAVVCAGLAALAVLRPGVLENGVRSPRAWLAVVAVVVAGRLAALVVRRATGRPRLAAAVSGLVVAGSALALVLPSFQQRTLSEPDPVPAVALAAEPGVVPSARREPGPPPAPVAARTVSRGELRGVGHSASGRTVLTESGTRLVLRFEGVDIEGTPGPYVHLVRRGARTPDGGVPLGALKAERGSFAYEVPAGVDSGAAWSVLVWCRPYDTPVAASQH